MKTNRFFRLVVVVAISILGLGCFVFDELDGGMAELNRRGPQEETKASSSSAQPAQAKSNLPKIDLDAWWRKSSTVTSEVGDPSITQCLLNGKTQFMRIDDCHLRGGTPR